MGVAFRISLGLWIRSATYFATSDTGWLGVKCDFFAIELSCPTVASLKTGHVVWAADTHILEADQILLDAFRLRGW